MARSLQRLHRPPRTRRHQRHNRRPLKPGHQHQQRRGPRLKLVQGEGRPIWEPPKNLETIRRKVQAPLQASRVALVGSRAVGQAIQALEETGRVPVPGLRVHPDQVECRAVAPARVACPVDWLVGLQAQAV